MMDFSYFFNLIDELVDNVIFIDFITSISTNQEHRRESLIGNYLFEKLEG